MALLNLSFTAEEIKNAQTDNFAPVPAGNYIAEVNRSEVKQTKDGRGSYLSLTFKILDGDFANRLVFQNITIVNANQTAQAIGRKQMSQLSGACGIMQLNDSQELHGKPMWIKVAIEVDKTGQYEPRNTIKKFMPLQYQHQQPQNMQPMQAAQPVQPVSTPAPNPWARQS